MPTRKFIIERGEEEIEVLAEYDRSRFYPATGPSWDSPGDPEEGGEPGNLQTYLDGKRFELTGKERIEIYRALEEDPRGEFDG